MEMQAWRQGRGQRKRVGREMQAWRDGGRQGERVGREMGGREKS